MSQVKFDASRGELDIIIKIVDRLWDEFPDAWVGLITQGESHGSIMMDIDACHSNGCPLQLQKLLEASRLDFIHDVLGIHRHIDRTTGKLQDCFLPRYNAL